MSAVDAEPRPGTAFSAISKSNQFSSSQFIATRHQEVEREMAHVLLQQVPYRNYIMDRQVSRPIVGLGRSATLSLLKQVLDSVIPKNINWDDQLVWDASNDDHTRINIIFDLEASSTKTDTQELFCTRSPSWRLKFLQMALWNDAPLLPITQKQIEQHKAGVSRHTMVNLLRTLLPEYRQEMLSAVF